MKNLLLFLLLTLCIFTSKAQNSINYSGQIKVDYEFLPNKYLGHEGDKHYLSYLIITDKIQMGRIKAQGIGIAVFNDSLNLVEKYELSGSEKDEKYIDVYKYRDSIFLFSYVNSKDVNTFYYTTFDLKGKKTIRNKIFTADEDNNFQILYAQDFSKTALIHSNNMDNGKAPVYIETVVFENGGNILWKNKTELKYNLKSAVINAYLLDKSGALHLFLYKKKEGSDLRPGEYVYINNTDVSYTEIIAADLPFNVGLSEIGGEIYLASMQYSDKDGDYKFPALTRLEHNESTLEITTDAINPDLLKDLITSKKYKEKKGWSKYMKHRQTWKTSDGKIKVAYEIAYEESYAQGRLRYISFVNKDVFVFTFNNDWQVEAIDYYPKNIDFDENSQEKNLSSVVVGDDLYLLYNDDEKNINKPKSEERNTCYDGTAMLTKVQKDGSHKTFSLNKKDKKLRCYPTSLGLFNNHLYIFVTQIALFKSKDARLVEIDLSRL